MVGVSWLLAFLSLLSSFKTCSTSYCAAPSLPRRIDSVKIEYLPRPFNVTSASQSTILIIVEALSSPITLFSAVVLASHDMLIRLVYQSIKADFFSVFSLISALNRTLHLVIVRLRSAQNHSSHGFPVDNYHRVPCCP